MTIHSSKETICKKGQSLFSGKNRKKNITKCRLLNFLPGTLNVNMVPLMQKFIYQFIYLFIYCK